MNRPEYNPGGFSSFNGSLKISVTAEFPSDNTGNTDELQSQINDLTAQVNELID